MLKLSTFSQIYTRQSDLQETVPPIRPILDWLEESSWQMEQPPAAKNGTLYLEGAAYGLPENDLPGIVQLHLNENLFTAAQTALSQQQIANLLADHLTNLHAYPTNGAKQLQDALAADLDVDPEKLVISHGSSNLLRDVILYLLKANETILVPGPSWSYYRAIVNVARGHVDIFPLLEEGNSFVYSKQLIAERIEATHPKVVLICSPNNPTGNVLPMDDFLSLVRAYPQVNFILDEAYWGFEALYTAAQQRELLESTEQGNVFVIRTFSKFYGLANLRIGFAICSTADGQNLQKLAPTFGLPSMVQALAVHRLGDQNFKIQMQREYAVVRNYLLTALQQIRGFIPYETSSNFMLVWHDRRWDNIEDTLLRYGYKIKRETIHGTRNYLRITLADMATMQNLIMAIRQLSPR